MNTALMERLNSAANRAYQRERGVQNPLSLLKAIEQGQAVPLVDGLLRPEDVLGPGRLGRKITLLGDTCDSREIARIAYRSDVLVHECTNAYIAHLDRKCSPEEVEARSYSHGHSTPRTAGEFARAIRCKTLLLTHFSRRYVGDYSSSATTIMQKIIEETKRFAVDCEVHCAHDFETFVVRRGDDIVADQGTAQDLARAYTEAKHQAELTKKNAQKFFSHHKPRKEDIHRVAAMHLE